jgi:hypothetical protein
LSRAVRVLSLVPIRRDARNLSRYSFLDEELWAARDVDGQDEPFVSTVPTREMIPSGRQNLLTTDAHVRPRVPIDGEPAHRLAGTLLA